VIRSVRPSVFHDLSSDRREPGWFLSVLLFYIVVREDRIFGIISVVVLIFINVLLFWLISALDLESINAKFLFYK
jgi:hypothetical protein